MNFKQGARLALGVAIAAFFIWLTLRHLDLNRMGQVVVQAHTGLLLLAIAVLAAGYASRIARWRLMLAHATPTLRFVDCAGPLLASFAANNVLPLRAGDLMRAFVFNDRLRSTPGTVLATLFVERLLDLLMVLVLLGGGLLVLGVDPGGLLGLGAPALLLAALAILVVVLFPQVLQPVVRMLGALAARLPAAARLQSELDRAVHTLRELAAGATMLRLLGWSAVVWLAEGGVFWLGARALPALQAPQGAWLAAPLGTLATLIPSTPGYVGTFDFFTARAMTLVGNEATAAAAFAFLVHFILWLPPTLAGGLYLLLRPAASARPQQAPQNSPEPTL
jgi:uncharacterized protein (TIRG00374 family)